ncbi:MAG: hypothetical protein V7724_07305 [Sediminicola sp.]
MKNHVFKVSVLLAVSIFSFQQGEAQARRLTKVFNHAGPPKITPIFNKAAKLDPPRVKVDLPSTNLAKSGTTSWSSPYGGNSFPNVSNISGSFNRTATPGLTSSSFNKVAAPPSLTPTFNRVATMN